jgi:molybdenum cofactor guanylyltransferase
VLGTVTLPVGALLAGGRGRRLGGDKAVVALDGRALLTYPLAALRAALPEVAVVAKRGTRLPHVEPEPPVWIEPDEPRHPLAGIVHALRCAKDRPVLVCAVDLPLVTAELVGRLAAEELGERGAVVARAGGESQPLFALYAAAALPILARAGERAPLREVVARLGAREVDLGDDDALLCNVNAPDDLLRASALLAARGG